MGDKKRPQAYQIFDEVHNALMAQTDIVEIKKWLSIMHNYKNGIEPINLSPADQMTWQLIKKGMDWSLQSYDTKVENGKKGGRPKKN